VWVNGDIVLAAQRSTFLFDPPVVMCEFRIQRSTGEGVALYHTEREVGCHATHAMDDR
jgi:hypothetical protein